MKLRKIENCGGHLTHDSGLSLSQPRLSGVGPMIRDGERVLQRVQMKIHPLKITGCILLMMKTLVWWHILIKGLVSRPLAVLHAFEPIEKQIAPKI